MRLVPVTARGSVRVELLERASRDVSGLTTLAEVLDWARAQEPPRIVAEIVTQDEYTHDVVLPFEDDHFLVFDAT